MDCEAGKNGKDSGQTHFPVTNGVSGMMDGTDGIEWIRKVDAMDGRTLILPTRPSQCRDLGVRTTPQEKYHGRRGLLPPRHCSRPTMRKTRKQRLSVTVKIKFERDAQSRLDEKVDNVLSAVGDGPPRTSPPTIPFCCISTVSPGILPTASSKPFHPTIGCA